MAFDSAENQAENLGFPGDIWPEDRATLEKTMESLDPKDIMDVISQFSDILKEFFWSVSLPEAMAGEFVLVQDDSNGNLVSNPVLDWSGTAVDKTVSRGKSDEETLTVPQREVSLEDVKRDFLLLREKIIANGDISDAEMKRLVKLMDYNSDKLINTAWDLSEETLFVNIFYREDISQDFKAKFAKALLNKFKYIDMTSPSGEIESHNYIVGFLEDYRELEFSQKKVWKAEYSPVNPENVYEVTGLKREVVANPENKVLIEKREDEALNFSLRKIFWEDSFDVGYNLILNPSRDLVEKENKFPGKGFKWEAFLNPKASENVLGILSDHLWKDELIRLFPEWITQNGYDRQTIANELMHANLERYYDFPFSREENLSDKLDVENIESGVDEYFISGALTLNEFMSDVASFSVNRFYFLNLIANIQDNWMEFKGGKISVQKGDKQLHKWYEYSFHFFANQLNNILHLKDINLEEWELSLDELLSILAPDDLTKIQEAYLAQWQYLIWIIKERMWIA